MAHPKEIGTKRDEAIKFADSCNPPEDINEVLFQAKDIWKRYS